MPATGPATGPAPSPFRSLFRLCLPIVGVNLGMMLMGTADSIMVGHLSASALAAVALGNVYSFAMVIVGIGVLLALDPVLAQALGAGEPEAFAIGVQRGLVLSIVLSIPIALALLAAAPVLRLFDEPPEVVPLAAQYCIRLIPGIPAFLAFGVGRQALQALGRVAPVLWAVLGANLLNVILNRVLIFGALGIPAMGVAGSAWATTFSRLLMLVMLYRLARSSIPGSVRPWRAASWQFGPLWRLLRFGLPIGLQLELEMAAFSIVALLMGKFGTVAVAGHQIAINLASVTFMVPMGVGMGAAVRVGHAVGRGDHRALRIEAGNALALGAGFMTMTGVLFLLWPGPLASLYTLDAGVAAFAATLLPIAGIFQLFDGVQAVCVGVLRGAGDTRTPMLVNLIGFGVIGLSSSLWLAYRTPLAARGLWWGLVVGLGAVASILVARVVAVVRAPIERVRLA
jgi:MATE family multidrug resistance protein